MSPAVSTPSLNRRSFLALAVKSLLAASGLLGLGSLARFLDYQGTPAAPETYDLGPAANYPPGSRTLIAEASALLIHDAAGFRAISLTCTHLGCDVKVTPDGFACPCHGSQFMPDGGVSRGPASKPLRVTRLASGPDGRLVYSPGNG